MLWHPRQWQRWWRGLIEVFGKFGGPVILKIDGPLARRIGWGGGYTAGEGGATGEDEAGDEGEGDAEGGKAALPVGEK